METRLGRECAVLHTLNIHVLPQDPWDVLFPELKLYVDEMAAAEPLDCQVRFGSLRGGTTQACTRKM